MFDLFINLAMDPANAWSIGSFGAIGEFMREADEPVWTYRESGRFECVTTGGAIRIAPDAGLRAIAWDNLGSDGESWGHEFALCAPIPELTPRCVLALGPDHEAVRQEDRTSLLFDLGVGFGCVRMCVRTLDPALIAALTASVGKPVLSSESIMPEVLRAQPHRVMLSPAGRLEVLRPLPLPGGTLLPGPHTHLLPKLIDKNRAHAATAPIPAGWQAAMTVYPRSPWRDMQGVRHGFNADADMAFTRLLATFELPEDAATRAMVMSALQCDEMSRVEWPQTRRGRAKARIVLRRLSAYGDERAKRWRAMYDHGPADPDGDEHG